MQSSKYETVETLPSGRRYKIRAVRPTDKGGLIEALGRSSTQSLYRRFFSPKRALTENEIAHFMDLDFKRHVALVAVLEDGNQEVIIAGARYFVTRPGTAEVAFLVVDAYQGQRVGQALMHHLVVLACRAGLKELIAEVLSDNVSMLRVFDRCGLPVSKNTGAGVVAIAVQLG